MAQDAVAATAPDLVNETPGGAGTLAVEIVHAASHEGAPHVEGVLIRRTRLYLKAGARGRAAAGPLPTCWQAPWAGTRESATVRSPGTASACRPS